MRAHAPAWRQGRCHVRIVSGKSHAGGAARISVLSWLIFAVLFAVSVFYIWQYLQTRSANGEGLIQLTGIELKHEAGQLHLQADARIRLPPTVQAGLDSGVPLTFVLNLTVDESRRFWPDRQIFSGERHYTLIYYELTRHYRVSQLETDASRNFRSLSSALAGLGQLGRISFTVDDLNDPLQEQQALVASLDMRLSTSALPLPLQPIIRSSWTVASEEYRWPII